MDNHFYQRINATNQFDEIVKSNDWNQKYGAYNLDHLKLPIVPLELQGNLNSSTN
jgi:hypothetical protein